MLIKFQNKEEIEIIYVKNEPYFKAKDICNILGFKNHHQAVANHCEVEGVISGEGLTKTGIKTANYINEQNLYALIFNVPKKFKTDTEEVKKIKDKAKLFQKWIFKEVLPSIRKTGKYEIKTDDKDNFLRHLDIEVQKQNVKIINAIKYKEGGVGALKNYHNQICKEHTGKTATELKKMAKDMGCKSTVYNSARQVVRMADKPLAGSMSIADQLAKLNKDVDITEICKTAKLSIKLFQDLEDKKLNHNFEELKN